MKEQYNTYKTYQQAEQHPFIGKILPPLLFIQQHKEEGFCSHNNGGIAGVHMLLCPGYQSGTPYQHQDTTDSSIAEGSLIWELLSAGQAPGQQYASRDNPPERREHKRRKALQPEGDSLVSSAPNDIDGHKSQYYQHLRSLL